MDKEAMDKDIDGMLGSIVTTDLIDFRHPNFKLKVTTSLGYVVTIFVGADDNDGYAIYRYDPFGGSWAHHWDSGVLFYEVSKDGVKDDALLKALAPYNNKKSFWLDTAVATAGTDDLLGLGSIEKVHVTSYYKYAFGMTIHTTKGIEVRVGTDSIYEKLHDYDVLSSSWYEHIIHDIDIYDVFVDGKSVSEYVLDLKYSQMLCDARAKLKSIRRDYKRWDTGCDSSDEDN